MEKAWACFCTEISDYRQVIDDTVSQWVDFENSSKRLCSVLTELSEIIEQDERDKIDHVTIHHSITRYQVLKIFVLFCDVFLVSRIR